MDAGILYFPNFKMMTCVEYRMAPPYSPHPYFSFNSQDCCMTYFAGMVAECMMHSSTDYKAGSLINVVEGSSKSAKSDFGWGRSFWMGKSGKTGKSEGKSAKSDGKSGKLDGKSGKSSGKSENLWSWANIAWSNQDEDAASAPTQLPTNLVAGTEGFPTNTPTILSPTQTASTPTHLPTHSLTSLPTTYIPTYNPSNPSTESIETGISTTHSPTPLASTHTPTSYPAPQITTPIPTLREEGLLPVELIPTIEPTATVSYIPIPNKQQPMKPHAKGEKKLINQL